jgi:hypothetical protein
VHAVAAHRLGLAALALGVCLLVGVAAGARIDERLLGAERLHSVAADTRLQLRTIERALVHWQADNEARCPTALAALYDEHYVLGAPRDGWGHPLRFVCPGEHAPDGADLVSAGLDGIYGTADDVRSWDR